MLIKSDWIWMKLPLVIEDTKKIVQCWTDRLEVKQWIFELWKDGRPKRSTCSGQARRSFRGHPDSSFMDDGRRKVNWRYGRRTEEEQQNGQVSRIKFDERREPKTFPPLVPFLSNRSAKKRERKITNRHHSDDACPFKIRRHQHFHWTSFLFAQTCFRCHFNQL